MAKDKTGNSTVILYADSKPHADVVTLQMSNEAGRPLTRTEAINMLIERKAAEIITLREKDE